MVNGLQANHGRGLDGEVMALDAEGRPSFNALQNYGSAGASLHFFIFDVLALKGKGVMGLPLMKRRALIEKHVLPDLADPIRYSPILEGTLNNLIESVKVQGLQGLIAKRRDSVHEPGLRSGAWMKMRVNAGEEFVIGGYTIGGRTFDALVFGYYDGDKLIYATRTRNGFTWRKAWRSCHKNFLRKRWLRRRRGRKKGSLRHAIQREPSAKPRCGTDSNSPERGPGALIQFLLPETIPKGVRHKCGTFRGCSRDGMRRPVPSGMR